MPQCTLQQDGTKEITVALRHLKNCKVIYFSSTPITDPVVVENISSLFNCLVCLQFFHANALFLFETEFYKLSNNLNKFASLKFLYIERCVFSSEAAAILGDTVSYNTNLKGLSLAYCEIPETELVKVFTSFNGLEYLNINNIKMRNLIKAFSAMIYKIIIWKLLDAFYQTLVLSCK